MYEGKAVCKKKAVICLVTQYTLLHFKDIHT